MSPKFYNKNAKILAQQYLSKSFEQVHKSWSQFLTANIENPNARILDLAAGSGRDAKYLAELIANTHNIKNNIQVFAAESVQKLPINTENTQIKRFFAEANIALQRLNSYKESIDALFELMVMQRLLNKMQKSKV